MQTWQRVERDFKESAMAQMVKNANDHKAVQAF